MNQSLRRRFAQLSACAAFALCLALAATDPLGGGALAQTNRPGQSPGASAENFPFVYVTPESGDTVIVRGNVVPVWPGRACFGWQLKIGGADREVKLTEVLTLSGPAKLWVAGPETKISPDQATATTMIPAQSIAGVISRAWCITEGDPPGQYRYDIYIDGQHRGQFTYCAVRLPYDPNLKIEELTCPFKFESVRDRALPGRPDALETAQNGL